MIRLEPSRARAGLYATVAIAVSVALFSCSENTSPEAGGTFFGPATVMAGGSGRAYVTLDPSGTPTQLGVALTEGALSGLPATTAEFIFALPSEASVTGFKHAGINWQPTGHPPAMVYTLPHFDVHFYSITDAQRQAILLGTPELATTMARRPADAFIPSGYVQGMASAQMGNHWNDPSEPQYSGAMFTKTFIYGSYDGAFIFSEPMLTKAYLETKPIDAVTTIKVPAQFASPGYHATSYTVTWDAAAREYRVALSGLAKH